MTLRSLSFEVALAIALLTLACSRPEGVHRARHAPSAATSGPGWELLFERDVNRVLDGDLDGFIKAYLMRKASGTLTAAVTDDDE